MPSSPLSEGALPVTATSVASAAPKYHIAFLRIVAILCVLFNHTEGYYFFMDLASPGSAWYWLYLFLSIACKMAVPLFFMVSGALLIPKQESLGALYKKRVLRFLIALLFFNLVFYGYSCIKNNEAFNVVFFFKHSYANQFSGTYWFLYSYLAMLVMLPFLRKLALAMDKGLYKYFFACQLVIVGMIPMAEFLLWRDGTVLNAHFSVPLVTAQNIFYVLLGYYAEHLWDSKRLTRKWVLLGGALGIAAIFICCVMTYIRGQVMGYYAVIQSEIFFYSLIAVPSFAVYLFAKYLFRNVRKGRLPSAVSYVGGLVFGIMLLDQIVRTELMPIYVQFKAVMPALPACFLYVLLSFAVAALITAVLKKIPGINKII